MVLLSVKFLSMTKVANKVFIAAGIFFFLFAAEELWLHHGIWATCWILLGVGLILTGVSFIAPSVRQKITRRLSLGFAGGALVFLIIASVQFFSQH
jgi:hypothetical protein